MGIRNSAVAKAGVAQIDIDKLNLLNGARVWYEDFEEAGTTNSEDIANMDIVVAATGDSTINADSIMELDAAADADKVIMHTASQWDSDRGCTMGVRVADIEDVADCNIQIGWMDAGALAAGIDGAVDDQDWAVIEYDASTDTTWQLSTNITGGTTVSVDTSVAVAASTIYDITVTLNPTGGVTATINGQKYSQAAQSGTLGVTADKSDWHAFVRIHAAGSADHYIHIDTMYCAQSRTDL